jgi:hypothetical protein
MYRVTSMPCGSVVALLAVAACGPLSSGCDSLTQVGPSGLGSGVAFESSWDAATGSSREAVTDGSRWPNYWEFHESSMPILSVVPDGVKGHNALRVQQRGPNHAALVQVDDILPQSQDYYVRFYMRNDDTSHEGDHVATVDSRNYGNLTFMRKYSDAESWRFVISMYGCGGEYPIAHWGPPARLAHGQWYRFEYFVHYTDERHIQVVPRVYDAADSLLYTDADFQQQDYKKGGVWKGRDDWTLASYYAAGYGFCVHPAWTNDFGLGNNGQRDAADTGRYWYFSAVQIRRDTWPGPVPAAPAH